jgi:hypothetical protein
VRVAGAAAVAAAVAFAVTGCGGSESSTTTSPGSELQSWAAGLCTAVGKYKASIAAARASLHVRQLSRPAIQVALQDASAARRQLADDLEELGPPPAPQPAEPAGQVVNELLRGLRKQANKIRSVVTNASGSGDVRQAASNTTDALTAATDEASQAVGELRKLNPKPEVEQAFDNADSCAAL